MRHAAEEGEPRNMPVAEGFRCLAGIGLHKAGVRVGKAHRQEVDLAFYPANDRQRLAKINLGMAREMRQRNKHLPLTLPGAADVVLHNRDPAREAVLIAQPLEDPLRCVPLLLRTLFIFLQDTVDGTDEGICPSSKHSGQLSLFHKGGSGSS